MSASSNRERLCECGCGTPTPIASRNRYDRGQRKGEPLRYVSGHNHVPPPPPLAGPDSPTWKGDDVGYFGLHLWLNRHCPKTGVCTECGQTEKRTVWAFLRHPEPHTRNVEDYRELCDKCHVALDQPHKKAWTTRRRTALGVRR